MIIGGPRHVWGSQWGWHIPYLGPKGLFTVSVSITKKWVPLISIVLFTLSDAKHQRERSLALNATLTVNRPLVPIWEIVDPPTTMIKKNKHEYNFI